MCALYSMAVAMAWPPMRGAVLGPMESKGCSSALYPASTTDYPVHTPPSLSPCRGCRPMAGGHLSGESIRHGALLSCQDGLR
nr:unnamed protein product [Digitaria exilis]